MNRLVLVLVLALLPSVTAGQTNEAARTARAWRQQHERAILEEFVALRPGSVADLRMPVC